MSAQVAAIELDDLSLTTRAHNSLDNAGIKTVDQLCKRRASDLLDIPYFGIGQLEEIEVALDDAGYALKPPLPPPAVSARQAAQRARRQRERVIRQRARRERT